MRTQPPHREEPNAIRRFLLPRQCGTGLRALRFCVLVLLMFFAGTSLFAQSEDVLRPKGRPVTKEDRAKATWEFFPERLPVALTSELGVNANFFSQSLQRTFDAGQTPNNVLSSGSGIGSVFGIGAEYQFRPDMAAQLRIGIDQKSYSNSLEGVIDFRDSSMELPRDMSYRADTKSSVTFLSFTPSLRYAINHRMFVSVGFGVHAMVSDLKRTDEIIVTDADPLIGLNVDYNLRPGLYRSISRTVSANTDMLQPIEQQYPAKSTEFVVYDTWRTTLEFGAGYIYPVDKRLAVVASLRYQYAMSSLNAPFMVTDFSRSLSQRLTEITYSDARIHSVQFTIGVWFKLAEQL
jgi:opacity protein-like surface antigen